MPYSWQIRQNISNPHGVQDYGLLLLRLQGVFVLRLRKIQGWHLVGEVQFRPKETLTTTSSKSSLECSLANFCNSCIASSKDPFI